LEAINPVLKEYPAFNEVSDKRDEAVAKIDKVLATEFKGTSDAYKLKKRETEQIDSWTTIKSKIESKFPMGTDEYLYINIFEQAPSRDDLANLKIFDTTKSLLIEDMDDPKKLQSFKSGIKRFADDGETNALILHRTGAIFAFFRYKTDGLYGDQYVKVDAELRQLIDDYVANGFIDTELFPFKGGKMTSFVSKMLKQAGLKSDSSKNKGAINLLRKALITHKTEQLRLLGDITAEDRIKLAKIMRHSVVVTPAYLRKIAPKYDALTQVEKKELDSQADVPLALPPPPAVEPPPKPKKSKRKGK